MLQGKTILVVDDDADLREIVARRLERVGVKVLEAVDGDEAIRMTRAEQPDLVLMDIMMPGTDGVTACRTLKEDPETEAIPIIMLTAKVDTETNLSSLVYGALDFLEKPVSLDVLLAVLEKYLFLP